MSMTPKWSPRCGGTTAACWTRSSKTPETCCGGVGHEDRSKLDEYLQSVRSVERRIEASLRPQRRWINASGFDLSRPSAGIPEQHVEHVRLMLDLLVLAFWTDTTRVATFMMGNAQTGRNFGFIDGCQRFLPWHLASPQRTRTDAAV